MSASTGCSDTVHGLDEMSRYWSPPKEWTVEEANRRAFEVFSDPSLSESNLPPEAGLLFPPKPPDYPPLHDATTGKPRFTLRKSQRFFMRDIPWLPEPFDMDTPGWKLNLYQIFGANCRDMVERVNSRYEPKSDRQFLSNRLVKRSGDYRTVHGGFCTDYKAFKNGRITAIAEAIVTGVSGKRKALDMDQIFFGVIWEIDPISHTMQQNSNSKPFPLPEPMTAVSDDLAEILRYLRIPIPTAGSIGWDTPPIVLSQSIGEADAVTSFLPATSFPPTVAQPILQDWDPQLIIDPVEAVQKTPGLDNLSDIAWLSEPSAPLLPYFTRNFFLSSHSQFLYEPEQGVPASDFEPDLSVMLPQRSGLNTPSSYPETPESWDTHVTDQFRYGQLNEEHAHPTWDDYAYYQFINDNEQ